MVFPSFPERGLTGENARANAVSRRALSPVLPKEGVNGGENARASVLRSEGVCSPVRIKIPVASADMRRHSDTLRGAQRRRKRGLRGENNRTSFLRSKVVVFPSYSKKSVFSRTCAGKRHHKSRERGDESGGQWGRKRVKRSDYPLSSPSLHFVPYMRQRLSCRLCNVLVNGFRLRLFHRTGA